MTRSGRRFALACASGAVVGFAVFLWFVATGPGGLFHATPYGLGGFYDAQARALFHGHWDASADSFFIERFNIDGRYFMYFGPWPSFLRMPVLLFTSTLDGELTGASLLVAFVILFAGIGRLLWQVRTLQGDARPSRRELWGVAGLVVLLACGSTIVFLGASAWVYDEAILWGAAWGVWSLVLGIAFLRRPTTTTLVLAAVFTALSILSRVSTGAAGVVLLGAAFVVQLARTRRGPRIRALGARLARVTGLEPPLTERRPWATGLAAFVPVAAYAGINWVKFGTLFSIPWDKQDVILRTVPGRRRLLAENGPQLVSLREVPTNVLHLLRPDGFTLHGLFPFVDFGPGPTILGGVARDPGGASASIPATLTLLVGLTLVGLTVVFVPRVANRLDLQGMRVLRLPVVAAAVTFAPILVIYSLAERYKADLTLLLALAGAVGMYALAALTRGRRAWRRAVIVGAALLLVLNVWTNLALTYNFQRGYQRWVSGTDRGAYVRARVEWTERLGLDPSADAVEWDSRSTTGRPRAGPRGAFLVVDDCAALLLSDGDQWLDVATHDGRATCRALQR